MEKQLLIVFRRVFLPVFLFGLCGVMPVSPVRAEMPAVKIAVVDVSTIETKSLVVKNIHEQMESKRATFSKSFNDREEDLRKREQELIKNRTVLSQEAFEEQRKQFKKDVAAIQRDAQKKQVELSKAYEVAVGQVHDKVVAIIKELSKEKGFDIALPTSQTLFTSDALDISDEVIERLNKDLPKIKVQFDNVGTAKANKKNG